MPNFDLTDVVLELNERPGHEKVRTLLYQLLVLQLGVDSRDIHFELPAPEVRGRMDALLGRTIFELKSDLRRERKDAERGLARYLREREDHAGERYVGIATDGGEFIAFFRKGNTLIEVGFHKVDPKEPYELVTWLQSAVAVGKELTPDAETVKREFGRDNLGTRRAILELEELWARIGQTAESRLKRDLWDGLLSVAYGAENNVGDDALFLQHTYLVIVAKSIAYNATLRVPPPDARSLLHGTAFAELGITGQNEPDFFDWILGDVDGEGLVMRISGHVSRFDLRSIQIDLLKSLYENLIDPIARHELGEYYTPDWLAVRMVKAAVDDPLEQRVLDPACGSGTFLFHAARSLLAAAEQQGMSPAAAVRLVTERVMGMDVHPVAVILARVTYLLALMPVIRKGRPSSLALPVYLGDAMQWNRTRLSEDGTFMGISARDDELTIHVPSDQVATPQPRRLESRTLRIPSAVAEDPALLDQVLDAMINYDERSSSAKEFGAWLSRQRRIQEGDQKILKKTFRQIELLRAEGRNHIWGYVARNLARPVWLSSDARKADVVVGNPPWVAYRHMQGNFQRRFREECKKFGLWVGGNVATQQDLSSYFFLMAASLYLRVGGKIAFVMPYASMSRQAYAGFRTGEVSVGGQLLFGLDFVDAWAFGSDVQPLFPVPVARSLLFVAKTPHQKRSLPA